MTPDGQPHPSAPGPPDHGGSRAPDTLGHGLSGAPDTPEPPTDEQPDAPEPPTDEQPDAPQPLTDEWVEWLAAKLSGCRVDSETDLIVQHRVADADGDEFCWHVRLEDGAVRVAAGPAGETASGPSVVTFISDSATARAISVGGASAQRAFLDGRLRLNGDVRLLISARPALAALAEAAGRPA